MGNLMGNLMGNAATFPRFTPKFSQDQSVRFIGGEGKIRTLQPTAGSWFYMIEMEMGPEPEMGRIGYETMILLPEMDILGVQMDDSIG